MLTTVLIDKLQPNANRLPPAKMVAPLVDLANRCRFINGHVRRIPFADWQEPRANRYRLAVVFRDFANFHRFDAIHAIICAVVPASP